MAKTYRNLSRALGAAIFLFAFSAFAQVPPSGFTPFPCPASTGGWTIQWSGPITSASYDNVTQMLYIVWNYKIVQAFANVPVGIQQALTYTTNPQQIYNNSIIPGYHLVMLSEKDHGPLQAEFGRVPYALIYMD